MANHKIEIADFFCSDFELIAIHAQIEDYQLAYFLNKTLSIGLKKCFDGIVQKHKKREFLFSKFTFDNDESQLFFCLVENVKSIQIKVDNQNLFSDVGLESFSTSYLVPEMKKVDYFLKIEGDFGELVLEEVLNKINTINKIQTAYAVSVTQIKSKNNLIF